VPAPTGRRAGGPLAAAELGRGHPAEIPVHIGVPRTMMDDMPRRRPRGEKAPERNAESITAAETGRFGLPASNSPWRLFVSGLLYLLAALLLLGDKILAGVFWFFRAPRRAPKLPPR